jgi:hypothetical protein
LAGLSISTGAAHLQASSHDDDDDDQVPVANEANMGNVEAESSPGSNVHHPASDVALPDSRETPDQAAIRRANNKTRLAAFHAASAIIDELSHWFIHSCSSPNISAPSIRNLLFSVAAISATSRGEAAAQRGHQVDIYEGSRVRLLSIMKSWLPALNEVISSVSTIRRYKATAGTVNVHGAIIPSTEAPIVDIGWGVYDNLKRFTKSLQAAFDIDSSSSKVD